MDKILAEREGQWNIFQKSRVKFWVLSCAGGCRPWYVGVVHEIILKIESLEEEILNWSCQFLI